MKKLLISLALPLLIFNSCKDESDPTDTLSCRPTQIIFNNNDTIGLVYNSSKKVVQYGNLDDSHYTFTYSGLTGQAQIGPQTYNLFFDALGRIVSMDYSVDFGPITYYYDFAFEYDAAGHIVRSVQTVADNALSLDNETYKDSMVYEGNNMVETYSYYKSAVASSFTLQSRTEIQYSATPNKLGYYVWTTAEEPISIIAGWDFLYHLFGKTSANLPTTTTIYNAGGTQTAQLTYTFLLNDDGYPTEENITRTGTAPGTRNRKISYTCD